MRLKMTRPDAGWAAVSSTLIVLNDSAGLNRTSPVAPFPVLASAHIPSDLLLALAP
jgi:hypothetical protein